MHHFLVSVYPTAAYREGHHIHESLAHVITSGADSRAAAAQAIEALTRLHWRVADVIESHPVPEDETFPNDARLANTLQRARLNGFAFHLEEKSAASHEHMEPLSPGKRSKSSGQHSAASLVSRSSPQT